jgi:hypothetical protein
MKKALLASVVAAFLATSSVVRADELGIAGASFTSTF